MLTHGKKVCNPFWGSVISRKSIDISRYALTGWGEEWGTMGVIWPCVNGRVYAMSVHKGGWTLENRVSSISLRNPWAPPVQVLDEQHAQQHFSKDRLFLQPVQLCAHLQIQRIRIQDGIQLTKDGVSLDCLVCRGRVSFHDSFSCSVTLSDSTTDRGDIQARSGSAINDLLWVFSHLR